MVNQKLDTAVQAIVLLEKLNYIDRENRASRTDIGKLPEVIGGAAAGGIFDLGVSKLMGERGPNIKQTLGLAGISGALTAGAYTVMALYKKLTNACNPILKTQGEGPYLKCRISACDKAIGNLQRQFPTCPDDRCKQQVRKHLLMWKAEKEEFIDKLQHLGGK